MVCSVKTARNMVLLNVLATLFAYSCLAQYGWRGRGFWGDDASGPFVHTEGGDLVNEDTVRTARETAEHSVDTPTWTNAPGFGKDVFTFARIIYKRRTGIRGPSWLGWVNDYPDSDLNLSFRLQQMTSLKTDPDGRVLKLTDPSLLGYPFLYMVQAGRMELRAEEVPLLRKYLLNGGVLMADDFWGTREWENFEGEMRRVLPDRNWTELPMDHPVFHCVFDIRPPKNNLQVPNIHLFERTYNPAAGQYGVTSRYGEDSRDVHVRAWLDDKGRIMIIAVHNSDNGDGWEREAEDPVYFEKFSEARAYPLAINVIFYLLTH